MDSAQDAFRVLLRDEVGPRLRALGLRGSGRVYAVPGDALWQLIGFQKSRSSDRNRAVFTVNLTAANKVAWREALQHQPWMGRRPSGNARYPVDGSIARFERLGLVMPGRKDQWWEIATSAAIHPVAEEVVEAIETYGLPWLRNAMKWEAYAVGPNLGG